MEGKEEGRKGKEAGRAEESEGERGKEIDKICLRL